MTWSEAQTAISDRNAEIERLKEDLRITIAVCNENTDLKKLVTELCDEVECHNLDHLQDDLIRRAREATRLSVITLESLAAAFAQKDTEIDRLKADVEYWHHVASEKDQLITELREALTMSGLREYTTADLATVDVDELVERAREATHGT